MKPKVVLHNAVSADGRIDWFEVNLGGFYHLTGTWQEDVTLAGSETILQALGQNYPSADEPAADDATDALDTRPVLAIIDSRGRIGDWSAIKTWPQWREAISICSEATPGRHIERLANQGVEVLIAGKSAVDLPAALEQLWERYGARVVRVESGGTLNGVLLRQGLVDEVSLVVHPSLVGGTSAKSMFRAEDLTSPAGVIGLRLLDVQKLAGDLVWLDYDVIKGT